MPIVVVASAIDTSNPITLTGIFQMADQVAFSVADSETGHRKWVKLGGYFSGGRVVEYLEVDHALVYRREGRDYTIKIFNEHEYPDLPSFSLSHASQTEGGKALKSFNEVPEGVKKMPAEAFLEFLIQEGYEIPEHTITAARSAVINKSTQVDVTKKLSAPGVGAQETPGEIVYAPRNPVLTTSLTYEQKGARPMIGYNK